MELDLECDLALLFPPAASKVRIPRSQLSWRQVPYLIWPLT